MLGSIFSLFTFKFEFGFVNTDAIAIIEPRFESGELLISPIKFLTTCSPVGEVSSLELVPHNSTNVGVFGLSTLKLDGVFGVELKVDRGDPLSDGNSPTP